MARDYHNPQAIPFGWHKQSQRMLTVVEAKNGLACECVCLACGVPLQARQGNVRAWHFAHAVETQCKIAAEAAIHQMAKQLVAQHGRVHLPLREFKRQIHGEQILWWDTIEAVVQPSGMFALENCQIEKTVTTQSGTDHRYRPDVLALLNGRPIAIEIFNTHAVDETKVAALREQGISVLEISVHDLLSEDPINMLGALEARLLQPSECVKWLTHVGDALAIAALNDEENRIRSQWAPKEAYLLRARELQALREQRKRAYREKMREENYSSTLVQGGAIQICKNPLKVTLKVVGRLPDPLFRELCTAARKLGGHFNRKYWKWEFMQTDGQQAHFLSLLQRRIDSLVETGEQRTQLTSGRQTLDIKRTNSSGTEIFFDARWQEHYEERAAIMQYEAGLTRLEAENAAFQMTQEAQSISSNQRTRNTPST